MTPDPRPLPDAEPGPGIPPANDPGGAHAKGYTADPDPNAPPVPDPIPLAAAPPGEPIKVPERDSGAAPTGRSEPRPYDPNERAAAAR